VLGAVDVVVVVVVGSVEVVVDGAVVVVGTVLVVVAELAADAVVVCDVAVEVCGTVVVSVADALAVAAAAAVGRSARTPGTVMASRTAMTTPAPGRRRHRRSCGR
jgi:hypothetical protein